MTLPLDITRKSLPGPEDITRVELPNGIIILARENFTNPSVVMNGYLSTGSIFDPEDKLGLNVFTSSMLTRGTETRNFNQIFDCLESAGASLNFGGNVHTTSFNGKSLVEDLPMLMDLLHETITQPVFPPDQVEKFRVQLLTGLAMRNQDTAEMASMAFDEILFANHPYRFPEEGNPETIQNITRQDLVNFHRIHYGPRGMVIVLVGAVNSQKVIDLVSERFGEWRNPAQPEQPSLPPLAELTKNERKDIRIPGKSQADIVMGCTSPLRKSADYMPASLGNNILGVFGMMGRIGDVVRVQSGLAYYAYTSLNSGTGPGSWEVSAGVNPSNIEKAIALIQKEVESFTSDLVTEEELQDSKANFVGRLPLSMESNGGVAGALLSMERYQLGLDYYQRYKSLVESVTREQIRAVAQTYLHPDRMAIAVAQP